MAQGLTLNSSLHCLSSQRLWEEPAPSLHHLHSLGSPSLAKPNYKYSLDISRLCAGNINLSTTGGTVAPPSREPVLSYTNVGLVLGRTVTSGSRHVAERWVRTQVGLSFKNAPQGFLYCF